MHISVYLAYLWLDVMKVEAGIYEPLPDEVRNWNKATSTEQPAEATVKKPVFDPRTHQIIDNVPDGSDGGDSSDGGSGLTEVSESDKIDLSELGKFKERISSDDRIDEEYYQAVKTRFSHGTDTAKQAFNKFVPEGSVADSDFTGTACFDPKSGKIYMSFLNDQYNPRGPGVTWFHEHGHMIDYMLGSISAEKHFTSAIKDDFSSYISEYGRKHHLSTTDEIYEAIGAELRQGEGVNSAVSDLLNGLSGGKIKGTGQHDLPYWRDDTVFGAEAFAHMYESQFDRARHKAMKKYFPTSLEKFESSLKTAVTVLGGPVR